MATILPVNGIHLNMNNSSLPNAGARLFTSGKAIPGNSTWTRLISFSTSASFGFNMAFRIWMGASRQSGVIQENFWLYKFGGWQWNVGSWGNTYFANAFSEGNGIMNASIGEDTTSCFAAVWQNDTGAYVNYYVEAYCSRWDQITVSY